MVSPEVSTYPKAEQRPDAEFVYSQIERLGLIDSDCQALWDRLLRKFPVLEWVEIQQVTPQDAADFQYTGGFFSYPDSQEGKAAICLVVADDDHFKNLMELRSTAKEATLVGVLPEDLTPSLLRQFIFAHEVGHAYQFLTQYAILPDAEHDIDAAYRRWDEDREADLRTLPIPSVYPSKLIVAQKENNLCSYFLNNPQLLNRIESSSLMDGNALVTEQETAYKNLPRERFADQFASNCFN